MSVTDFGGTHRPARWDVHSGHRRRSLRLAPNLLRVVVALALIVLVPGIQAGQAKADGIAYAGWDALGGVALGAPTVTTWGPGRLDMFVKGSDNNLWHKQYVFGWGGWESLGAPPVGMASDPAAVAMRPGRIDVFDAGGDGQLWHRWYESGWSGWEPLGGGLTGAPAVSSWASGRLDVFVKGTDSQLWHKWYQGGWSGWEPLGGGLSGAPAAVSWSAGRIDVFVAGTDRQLWHKWYAGGWSAWQALGGQVLNAPGVSSWGPGRLDIYVQGSDSNLWHLWYALGWSGWALASSGLITSGPGVVSWGANRVDVFARGNDDGIYHLGGDLSPSSWTIQPNPPGNLQISGLSCLPLTFCMAVGSAGDGSGALAERWDGVTWTQSPMDLPAGGFLNAVSCSSPTYCLAVGGMPGQPTPQPIAMYWNGSTWTNVTVPFVGGSGATFSYVACVLFQCIADGNSFKSVFYGLWEGGTTFGPITFFASGGAPEMSCPAVNNCVAAGGSLGPPLYSILVWNGTTWASHTYPTGGDPATHPGGVSGISCPTITTCIVTGTNGNRTGIGGIWNGTTLTLKPVPGLTGESSLGSVSCASTVSCTALGSDATGPMIAHWDGAVWTTQPAPKAIGASYNNLSGVSCLPTGCTAFGSSLYPGTSLNSGPLLERGP